MGVTRAILYSDSQLVTQQNNRKFEVKNDKMIKYAQALDQAREALTKLIIEHISRAKNRHADQLEKTTSSLSRPTSSEVAGLELASQIEH